MHNDHTVHGVTADLAKEFHPCQWVNLYRLDQEQGEQLSYLGRYQVKDLPDQTRQQADQFALEPLDDQGNVISVQQALDRSL